MQPKSCFARTLRRQGCNLKPWQNSGKGSVSLSRPGWIQTATEMTHRLNQPSVCFFLLFFCFYGVVYSPVPLNKQITVEVDLCSREHRLLLPPTLQIVIPFTSPVTVHLKVKVLPGQVGGGVVNCPATLPTRNRIIEFSTLYTLHAWHPFSWFYVNIVGIWLSQ